ncbi:MAG TPA: alpha/beta hydrolase, partial [Anaerolineae bacterium]|nr:alpha/beta hydrolase [Anaerolineae bacterium]
QFGAECFSQTDPEMLTANIDRLDETYTEYKPEELFAKIQCPVLLLQANPELGGLMRNEDVDRALSLLPVAHHVKIHNVGHLLHVQDREAVINAVVPFLRSLS